MTRVLKSSIAILLLISGCSRSQPDSADPDIRATATETDDHAGHDHAAEGPHHGRLMEMGDGELHAELVHGRDWATVYILAANASSACPIDQSQILINVTTGNQGSQFILKASPEKSDPAGSCSRFVSAESQLVDSLISSDSTCRISIMNAGIPYGALVPHKEARGQQHK